MDLSYNGGHEAFRRAMPRPEFPPRRSGRNLNDTTKQ